MVGSVTLKSIVDGVSLPVQTYTKLSSGIVSLHCDLGLSLSGSRQSIITLAPDPDRPNRFRAAEAEAIADQTAQFAVTNGQLVRQTNFGTIFRKYKPAGPSARGENCVLRAPLMAYAAEPIVSGVGAFT